MKLFSLLIVSFLVILIWSVQAKKGIGLGLSLVRAIIHSHGGVVEAKSELEKGSIFTIHLPLPSN